MKMQKIKNEKGITLIILIITIVVLILISVPVIVNTTDVQELQRYSYFKGDIDKLRETIETTYMHSTDLSTIGPLYTGDLSFLNLKQGDETVKNPNDDSYYYVISLNELNSHVNSQISLKYGEGNKQENYTNNQYSGDNVYIINAKSKTIYYTNGIKYKDVTYYRLPESFTKQEGAIVVSYDANGGVDAPEMQTFEQAGETIEIANAPQRDGYTFTGYLDADNEILYQPGEEYVVNETITFIAQWQEN